MHPVNHTKKEWLLSPENGGSKLGTGIFLIPAPDRGVLSFRKVLVSNLEYPETAKRAVGCPVFKWVPQHVAKYEDLTQLSCANISCISSDDCLGISCLCSGGTCY